MFGKEYFEIRQRLEDVIERVLQLAEKTGAEQAPLLTGEIGENLTGAILFTVCGEVNAGKSTFLNALVGEELCAADALPRTKELELNRHHRSRGYKASGPSLVERSHTSDFLIDFNLIDTPGINALSKEQREALDPVLEQSDLIFWVFPTSNPWAAETWDLISKQSEEGLNKSIIVIQQSDLRDEKDLEVILGHMSDLSRKRVGMVPAIFPVSAKLALEARLSNSIKGALWVGSGFDALEKHISNIILNTSVYQKALHDVRDAIAQVLRGIEDMIEKRRSLLEGNEGFLREIEMEVEGEREKQSSDFDGKFSGMREVFMSQSINMRRVISKRLSVFTTLKSFFTTENISKKIEYSLVESVELAVKQQAGSDANQLVDECRKHWESVCPRVKERLSLSPPSFDEETAGFKETCDLFVERMGDAAKQAVTKLNMRAGIDSLLFKRKLHLKKWLYAVLVLLIVSGVLGGLQVQPYPLVALGVFALAVILAAGFAVRTKTTQKEVIASLSERMEDSRIPFADMLGVDYREGLRDFFLEYGNLLESVRRHISNAKLELQPNLEEWNGLFLELKEIEQKL